jgi:hypothetical protein
MYTSDTARSFTVESVDSRISQKKISQKIFFYSLVFVTALPVIWLGFGLALFRQNDASAQAALLPLIAISGIGHVGATAFFYFDRDFFKLIGQNKQRFFLWPAMLAIGCLAVFATNTAAWTLLVAAFFSWQLYHFQRQNYGLIAFAARSAGLGKLPDELTWMLNFGVAGAVCNLLRRIELKGALAPAIAYDLSVVLFLASTVLLLKVLLTTPRLRADLPVVIFTVLGWMFYLPTLVSTNDLVGYWSYAIAHGAQYIIFMIVVSGNRKHGTRALSLFLLLFAAMLVAFDHLNRSGAGMAAYTGLVMGHFLIDAKIWRLREPIQGSLIKQRFAFIFS